MVKYDVSHTEVSKNGEDQKVKAGKEELEAGGLSRQTKSECGINEYVLNVFLNQFPIAVCGKLHAISELWNVCNIMASTQLPIEIEMVSECG